MLSEHSFQVVNLFHLPSVTITFGLNYIDLCCIFIYCCSIVLISSFLDTFKSIHVVCIAKIFYLCIILIVCVCVCMMAVDSYAFYTIIPGLASTCKLQINIFDRT